jgi:hypothetical protein
MTYEKLQNIRTRLRKEIDPANRGNTPELSEVSSILLKKMEEMSAVRGPQFKEAMRGWAKNEQSREAIEKIIGGKIETFDKLYAANPEKIVDRIFSNPNYFEIAKEFIDPKVMDSLLQAKISKGIEKAFDSAKGFQPHTVKTYINSNRAFLDKYATPEMTQRLEAIADRGYFARRFLDDVNPSGSAASILSAINPKQFIQKISTQGVTGAVQSEVAGRINQSLSQRQGMKTFAKAIGEEPQVRTPMDFSKLNSAKDKVGEFIGKTAIGANASKNFSTSSQIASVASGENNTNEDFKPNKFIDDGIKKLRDIDRLGEIKDSFSELKKTKKGQDLLLQASDMKPDSPALQKIIEKIKQTEEYKKSLPKSSGYPKKLIKDGFQAVVKNEQEHKEAISEGWA